MFDGLLAGFAAVLSVQGLLLVLAGCTVGTLIGMLPGLGPITAIALMIPVSYSLDPAGGLMMMAGVYYGSVYGGSTSSILLNAPGVASTVATSFDGYPMARQGRAGTALAIAAYASFIGGTIGAVLLTVAAGAAATLATHFQSADYFLLMALGLLAVSAFTGRGELPMAVLSSAIGLALATIGTDPGSGIARFTLGQVDLIDGIAFVLLAMAAFALAEALMMVLRHDPPPSGRAPAMADLALTRAQAADLAPPTLRASLLGFVIGVLPGAGATVASFLAWSAERQFAGAGTPFGTGNPRGVAAPEAANNAACTGSFVPLLTLGIPGSGTTAVLLGVLLGWGITPGPRLILEHPEVFWGVIASMYVGNVILLVLNLPLVPWLARLLLVPRPVLIPLILLFALLGVYLVSFNDFDLYLMAGFAGVALFLRLCDMPMAPMLLAFILGGPMEENLRRALLIADGDVAVLWARPSSQILIAAIAVVVVTALVRARRAAHRRPPAGT